MHKYKKYANKTLHKKKSCYNKKHTQNNPKNFLHHHNFILNNLFLNFSP